MPLSRLHHTAITPNKYVARNIDLSLRYFVYYLKGEKFKECRLQNYRFTNKTNTLCNNITEIIFAITITETQDGARCFFNKKACKTK